MDPSEQSSKTFVSLVLFCARSYISDSRPSFNQFTTTEQEQKKRIEFTRKRSAFKSSVSSHSNTKNKFRSVFVVYPSYKFSFTKLYSYKVLQFSFLRVARHFGNTTHTRRTLNISRDPDVASFSPLLAPRVFNFPIFLRRARDDDV